MGSEGGWTGGAGHADEGKENEDAEVEEDDEEAAGEEEEEEGSAKR
jgi:hypothetical protein